MGMNAHQILEWFAGAWVRTAVYNWLLRQGADRVFAHAVAWLAGCVTVRAITAA
ncbi:hypothetical protein ACFQY7_17985 [Actinomadura luteofluorescens]|uniref:Uncharacterized protein n=1 Tax=Actinomadura luteofluorescens TaxID=46163 RepID=A0A7Y9ERF8_9ACTN|nr:hypothetical protein [Actinomadura luteofluorescens]NYD51725.1 hypothetical protein [Actinomadura luteofluorescens]